MTLDNIGWGTFRHAPDLTLWPQDFMVDETADGLAMTITVRTWGTMPAKGEMQGISPPHLAQQLTANQTPG